jgi:uncharacterized protein (DUF362 family)
MSNISSDNRQCVPDTASEQVVVIARSECAGYGLLAAAMAAPEGPPEPDRTVAFGAIRDLFASWGLDREHSDSEDWNPLGAFIHPGAKVVLKPNWVRHWNRSGAGLDCILTHTTVIAAVLEYVARARPGSVVIGDAPLQSCDFLALRAACGLDELSRRFQHRGFPLEIRDFRRTVMHGDGLGAARSEAVSGIENYVLFDLKQQSLLEPISNGRGEFRVTVYNPDLLQRTHGPGQHQYLVARACIDADVVINLPKLKCHKKAGLTGALKNLVGINGNKEYLPHHRKGGCSNGGDCYAGASWVKRQAENLLDAANRQAAGPVQRLLAKSAWAAARLAVTCGADDNLEGSWYGNDTIWRTCLDLQRILRYGKLDGTFSEVPQRQVISITDAIVAGEGEGPLAPTPVPARFITGAANPAAADWVHARLMGFDPQRIPLVREAFADFPYRLADFDPAAIRVRLADGEMRANEIRPFTNRAFQPPSGWAGHCEMETISQ